jgi:S-adenosylmethionine synthetase
MSKFAKHYFTSESVTEGHPDKMCDQISDAVLDAYLQEDPSSRVAVETATKTGLVILLGEITSKTSIDVDEVVREVIKGIGYDDDKKSFDHKTCAVLSSLSKQSPDIALGVDSIDPKKIGAGDQGMMFGYACNESPTLYLTDISSTQLTKKLAEVRKSGKLDYILS